MVPFKEKDLTSLGKKLSRWYLTHARALPWRKSHDPYRIWISEVMLQQTQVAAVIPYYERFLSRFPDVTDLAKAKEADVLSLWSGLGYYSRARNLLCGAKYLVTHFHGNFPKDRETLLNVPGIGPYTAGAILSIAFDLKVPIVDGNVQRVFSRLYALETPIETRSAQNFFWQKATDWVNETESPRVLNQALMELGATLCTKGSPLCDRCPLKADCRAYAKGLQEALPKRMPKREKVDLFWQGFVLESRGKFFLQRNSEKEWWSGLWDLPRTEVKLAKDLLTPRKSHLGLSSQSFKLLGVQKHTVTHHRIRISAFHATVSARALGNHEGKWFSREEIDKLAVSSLVRKIFHSFDS